MGTAAGSVAQPLPAVPSGVDIFVDANVVIHGVSAASAECHAFLERCARQEVTGYCLFEIVNEATHKFMLPEAYSKGLIPTESASALRSRRTIIPTLSDYWVDTQRVLSINLGLVSSEEDMMRTAEVERKSAALLTNDSMIVACMRHYGIRFLATRDADFLSVSHITVFKPTDI